MFPTAATSRTLVVDLFPDAVSIFSFPNGEAQLSAQMAELCKKDNQTFEKQEENIRKLGQCALADRISAESAIIDQYETTN